MPKLWMEVSWIFIVPSSLKSVPISHQLCELGMAVAREQLY